MNGCTEQFDHFRNCYLQEKRKFIHIHENKWEDDPMLIPNYLKEQILLQKNLKMDPKMAIRNVTKNVDAELLRTKRKIDEGYF